MGDKYNKWGSNDYYNSEPDTYYVGGLSMVPNEYAKGQQSNSQQWVTKNSTVDKQSGCYAKTSVKQSYSSGDVFKERSTGRVGYKDEFKTTKTFKVGDKSGYSECQVEERFRRVDYGSGSSTGKNKKYLK